MYPLSVLLEVWQWQEELIARAKAADPVARWTVSDHGKGRAVIVEDGDVWEKGCISVTVLEAYLWP